MKHLIITGDDFGISPKVNESVERHHQAGLLTQASLMVNETSLDEAVRIARRNPGLCVGLHLTLCGGRASRVSRITDATQRLTAGETKAGLRYAFDPRLRDDLRSEIERQFARFTELGFAPAYWDGHTHLHMHPTILSLALPVAAQRGFRAMRLVRPPRSLAPLACVFQLLSRAAIPKLRAHGVRFVDEVHGLSDTGKMDTARFERALSLVRDGWSELYFHPGAEPAGPRRRDAA